VGRLLIHTIAFTTDGTETLLQYGYYNALFQVKMAPDRSESNTVDLAVDICDQFNSCKRETMQTEVILSKRESDLISSFGEENIKAKNFQKLLQGLVPNAGRDVIKKPMVRSRFS